jgi:sarcosine oxidase subunit beta
VSSPDTYDVAVVGGGIHGCSAAYFLARAQVRTVLLERRSACGLEASGVNAGSLVIQNKPLPMIELSMAAARYWHDFEAEIGQSLGVRRTGGFRVCLEESRIPDLERLARSQRERGLEVRTLGGAEVRAMAPYIGEDVKAGNYCELDGYADPLLATVRTVQAAERRGLTVLTGREVTRISAAARGRYLVETARENFLVGSVVLTAGARTKDVDLGGRKIPLNLRINQAQVTDQSPHFMEHVITHIDGNLTLKQKASGNVLIGGGWRGQGDYARNVKRVSYHSLLGNVTLACRVVPALRGMYLIRSWAGFDGRTDSELPAFGQIPDLPGVFVSVSSFGGFVVGPLVGKSLADLVLGKALPEEMRRFAPPRELTVVA